MVAAEFTKYISEDLHRPLEDTRPLLEEDQLIGVVFSVLRLRKFDFLDALREETYAAIKATVKQAVVESISEVEVDTNISSVADQARVLTIASWLTLLSAITSRLNIVIHRVKVMIDVMFQAVEASAGNSNPTTDGVQAASLVTLSNSGVEAMLDSAAYTRAHSGLKEVLCATCDYAHDRCAKLLHARSRDHGLDKMKASEFLTLSRIIETFVVDTEKVCGRKSTTFRMGLQGQATRFVSRFHEERDARLKLNLGSERWRPVPAPPDLQRLLDHIISTDTLFFPPSPVENGNCTAILDNKSTSEVAVTNGNHGSTSATTSNGLQSSSSTSSLNTLAVSSGVMVQGEEYVVVGVCVVVVRLIVEYSECATTLRLAAQQLLTRLTDLLRKFNSDTCRLLIEAGAVALGLKTITTRNLALAWRSLQLLLLLLPRLKIHFSDLLRPVIVEKNIEQLTREYKEHCQAIENKIVGVVSDLIDRHLTTWEARSPVPSASFNGILRATSKLHEAVSGVLPSQQKLKLFERVTSVLKEKLRMHLVRLNVSSVGPQSWVVTSELTFYFNHVESLGQGSLAQEDFTRDLWPQKTSS
ncbi:unnamed protein product [Meganyctiphanes norvegica]|uniref:Vacuolar protein sorting-associated protein 54 C-terminal domain-containing protein n=1 Tax=Meganyctiphanes norvegica TaxID=48144 RepID=A0AAV2Q4F6_MEGNR